MFIDSHPILTWISSLPNRCALVGSRMAGKYSDDSDYDILIEFYDHAEYITFFPQLEDKGFIRDAITYGRDPLMLASDVWHWEDENNKHQPVDVICVDGVEFDRRMRFLNGLRDCGRSSAGLFSRAMKSEKAWPTLWRVLDAMDA